MDVYSPGGPVSACSTCHSAAFAPADASSSAVTTTNPFMDSPLFQPVFMSRARLLFRILSAQHAAEGLPKNRDCCAGQSRQKTSNEICKKWSRVPKGPDGTNPFTFRR